MVAKGFYTGRVAQVEPKDLEPLGPFGKVSLLGVPGRRIAGKPGGDDEVGSGAQQLDSSLVADLDPPSRQQGHSSRQVCQLGPFGKVELGACRAELIVKMVDPR